MSPSFADGGMGGGDLVDEGGAGDRILYEGGGDQHRRQ